MFDVVIVIRGDAFAIFACISLWGRDCAERLEEVVIPSR